MQIRNILYTLFVVLMTVVIAFVVAFLLLQTHRIGPIQVMLLAGLARVGASLLLGI